MRLRADKPADDTTIVTARTKAQIPDKTMRKDRWWRAPMITAGLLSIWVAYATVHVFLGRWYWVPRCRCLTPFTGRASAGSARPDRPAWVTGSAISHSKNLHRCFFYLVILISVLNAWDVAQALRSRTAASVSAPAPLKLGVNVVLLWAYTLSCHSCRHITGGRLRHLSMHPARYRIWTRVSWLNARHMQLAWTTLGTLMLADLCIWLVASGTISDFRFFN